MSKFTSENLHQNAEKFLKFYPSSYTANNAIRCMGFNDLDLKGKYMSVEKRDIASINRSVQFIGQDYLPIFFCSLGEAIRQEKWELGLKTCLGDLKSTEIINAVRFWHMAGVEKNKFEFDNFIKLIEQQQKRVDYRCNYAILPM